jgi:hypothetical protein
MWWGGAPDFTETRFEGVLSLFQGDVEGAEPSRGADEGDLPFEGNVIPGGDG